jgi:hypothetical protein
MKGMFVSFVREFIATLKRLSSDPCDPLGDGIDGAILIDAEVFPKILFQLIIDAGVVGSVESLTDFLLQFTGEGLDDRSDGHGLFLDGSILATDSKNQINSCYQARGQPSQHRSTQYLP